MIINIDVCTIKNNKEKAKIPKGLKNLNFQQMDATNLAEFDDNTFDITLISFALHDMPEIIQKRILIKWF